MLVINDLIVPKAMEALLDSDHSHSPANPMLFSQLVKPRLHEHSHDLIPDFKFYSKGLIELETNGLYKWLGTDSEIMWLGKEDVDHYPGNIIPAKTILIGDFGWGSDTGIFLDYRLDLSDPRLLINVWARKPKMAKTDNRCVMLASNVEEFLNKLGY